MPNKPSNMPSKRDKRELAKQARIQAQKHAHRANARRRVTSFLVVAGAIALVIFLFKYQSNKGKGLEAAFNEKATGLGCTSISKEEPEGSAHINPPQQVSYDRMPPDSGDHYNKGAPGGPAFTGVHSEQIDEEAFVHNLEHGHVGIHYRPGLDPAIVSQLESIALADDRYVFVHPYADMDKSIDLVFTAWRYRATCENLLPGDAVEIGDLARAFVEARRDKAPESVPGSVNAAGSPSSPTPTSTMPDRTGGGKGG